MSYITTKDGIQIYYKDWGSGQPIVFSHGWPLSADDWDPQMLFFLSKGYRVIAHDRRGHGRSTQVAEGRHGPSQPEGCDSRRPFDRRGEVVRYLARHGDKNVAKAAIISAVPPLMVKTSANPLGLPKNGTLKTYKDYPHGMITTQADVINADLLAFIKS